MVWVSCHEFSNICELNVSFNFNTAHSAFKKLFNTFLLTKTQIWGKLPKTSQVSML